MSRESVCQFKPRWKEELVPECPEGSLVIELTMGVLEAYFPTPERWNRDAPTWARARYEELLEALRTWCARQRIPLVVEEAASVREETASK
jgi:hypothetical protein